MSLSLYNSEDLVKQFDSNRTIVESLILREYGGSLMEHCKRKTTSKVDATKLMNITLEHYFENVSLHRFKGDILESLKNFSNIISNSFDITADE